MRTMSTTFDGVVLIAHGARDERWMVPFHRMRAELEKKLAPARVALSFLDFAPPKFADAVAEVCAAGARRVLVAPVFLSGGGHVAKDVPELVAPERARYPHVTFTVAGAIGEEPEVASAMAAAVVRLAGC
jgi:sirohydrochlorin cobaltochelatase